MKVVSFLLATLVFGLGLTACGPSFRAPQIDESGSESGSEVPERSPSSDPAAAAPAPVPEPVKTLSLDQATNIRKNIGGILEFVVELPAQSRVTVPVDYQISQPDVRNSNGGVDRSSTGFVGSVKIVSTPDGSLSSAQINAFNKLNLYVSASVVAGADTTGSFKVIAGAAPGAGFKALYADNGQPLFAFTSALKKRFANLNTPAVDADVAKSTKILAELALVANRKVATPKMLLLIDKETAKKFSVGYEQNGAVSTIGAWSIAVGQTAVRHGFENVPCAEFMSESIREAYQRAGDSVHKDFPSSNPLIWSATSSVEGLSTALHAAGWVPWETARFRPPTGAIMMHETGLSPGHTFMNGGDDGRIVVDNGSPQGRDLRTTSASILKLMYKNGVFFLPPGISPKPW